MLKKYLQQKNKEFDETFLQNNGSGKFRVALMNKGLTNIKSFLHQSHLALLEEVKKMCEEQLEKAIENPMRDSEGRVLENYNKGYNNALDTIISKLSEVELKD